MADFRRTPSGSLEVLDGGAWMHVPTRAADEIEALRYWLAQTLIQWAMYADMHEREDGDWLADESSIEGEMYRTARSLAHPR